MSVQREHGEKRRCYEKERGHTSLHILCLDKGASLAVVTGNPEAVRSGEGQVKKSRFPAWTPNLFWPLLLSSQNLSLLSNQHHFSHEHNSLVHLSHAIIKQDFYSVGL